MSNLTSNAHSCLKVEDIKIWCKNLNVKIWPRCARFCQSCRWADDRPRCWNASWQFRPCDLREGRKKTLSTTTRKAKQKNQTWVRWVRGAREGEGKVTATQRWKRKNECFGKQSRDIEWEKRSSGGKIDVMLPVSEQISIPVSASHSLQLWSMLPVAIVSLWGGVRWIDGEEKKNGEKKKAIFFLQLGTEQTLSKNPSTVCTHASLKVWFLHGSETKRRQESRKNKSNGQESLRKQKKKKGKQTTSRIKTNAAETCGEKERHTISLWCPRRVCNNAPLSACHTCEKNTHFTFHIDMKNTKVPTNKSRFKAERRRIMKWQHTQAHTSRQNTFWPKGFWKELSTKKTKELSAKNKRRFEAERHRNRNRTDSFKKKLKKFK